ncbi:group 1 glycosyl transferase [Tolypothrix tenuis PCC 7101]|uniref:Group 1 glycosyl transferase n=1 Tax=Tolypothrix tenuis PCC 7101 TaxID=231146 RepID=A0A1Z4N817_9CYAN|nr:glycosyltransferase family 4 protein [Aulosira sp. FACHB-113]BAZ01866.1 group 1 glycosyl transferase [Tolypothrix tenuis PCC 7101]BAZ74209.1 group 1 glycosyl transferase [Aulosira laxa NIES-50]
MQKLAIIASHPIQYYAPWFQYLSSTTTLAVKVFYLWDSGITQKVDVGFGKAFQWDIPLLTGYDYEFVANISPDAGTHHFWGLQNPSLISQINNYQPDAVLLMSYNYASIYHFLLCWNYHQIPLLFRGDSHRLLSSIGIKAWVRRQIITKIYQRFAACLYVGKANYEYFRYYGVAAKRLFFSPHAIDNDRFFAQAEIAKEQANSWKQEIGIPKDHAIILFAGKFEAKKRPLDLLQAFLQAKLHRVSLLFVGAGILENDLKSQAAGYANIYFAPFQNQSLMARTYAIADVVVLPSYGNYETWGLAINEAMCLSRPVIVSNHVGCAQDLVHPGKNGLIFPAGDVLALTHILQEAFSNLERLHNWGQESRNIILEYSYRQSTQGVTQALDSIMNGQTKFT